MHKFVFVLPQRVVSLNLLKKCIYTAFTQPPNIVMKLKPKIILPAVAGLICAVAIGIHTASEAPSEPLKMAGNSGSVKQPKSAFRESIGFQAGKSVQAARVASSPFVFKIGAKFESPYQPQPPQGVSVDDMPRPKTVFSSYLIEKQALPNLTTMSKGQKVGLPVNGGDSYDGEVNVIRHENGTTRVGGALAGGEGGFTLSQKGNVFSGLIRVPAENRAYAIETLNDGRVLMQEHRLDEWLCVGMKRKEEEPSVIVPVNPGAMALAVPLLDTRPTALGVIFLDFDGAVVTDPSWANGVTINAAPPTYLGQPLSAAHITSVVNAVAEDFAPFNVTVTTDPARYDNALPGLRMRCIVTPTDPITNGAAAGVAYIGSWAEAGDSYTDDIPCWCFGMYEPASMALVISHEVGHAFGLSHDGTTTAGAGSYYGGHGTGATSWGPIMGAPYLRTMTQWSRGEYSLANNNENDVGIISNAVNGVGYLVDDYGGTIVTANTTAGSALSGVIDVSGIISSSTDEDWFQIVSHNGPLVLSATPTAENTNLDITLIIRDSAGVSTQISAPTVNKSAAISTTLTAGTYYISISGSGEPSPPATGYTTYGSIGAYRILGSFTPVPTTPQITTQPQNVAAVDGSTATLSVTAVAAGGLTYQWFKTNALGAELVSGGNQSSLKLTGMSTAKAGNYFVRVRNASDPSKFTDSDPALVSIIFRPKIVSIDPKTTITKEAGQSHSITVTATGTQDLTYIWERVAKPANVEVKRETVNSGTNTLTFPSLDYFDAGVYRARVTNASGVTVNSANVTLKVDSKPVILDEPDDLVIERGKSGTLKVVAGGIPKLNYSWYKVDGGGEVLVGGNSPSLSVREAGSYRVKISNTLSAGVPTVSRDALVEIDDKPLIVSVLPAATNFVAGDNVNIVVTAGGSSTGRTYKWFKDGKPYTGAGAAADTIPFPSIAWQDRGTYFVEVRNRVGVVKSKSIVVKVSSKPVILTQPVSFVGATGGTAVFTTLAGGDPTLRYQWFKDGSAITPAPVTNPKLSLSKLQPGQAGTYFCRVSNGHPAGNQDTNSVTLAVEDPPKVASISAHFTFNGDFTSGSTTVTGISSTRTFVVGMAVSASNTVLPANVTVQQIIDNTSVVLSEAALIDAADEDFTVINPAKAKHRAAVGTRVSLVPSFTGTGPFTFQWLQGGKPYTGAGTVNPTTGVLSFVPTVLTDTGSFTVTIRNRTPLSVKSAAVPLSILIPPSITRPPTDVATTETVSAAFSLDATGSASLQYQWYKIETVGVLEIRTKLSGKTAKVLTFNASSQARDAGNYRCVVTNDVGISTSPLVKLSVAPVPQPGIISFQPTKSQTNEKISVIGTNLEFVTGAKIGGKTSTFTKVSPTEVLLTVPANLAPLTPSGSYNPHAIELTSLGGSFQSANQLQVYNKVINDDVIDAVILRGSQVSYSGDNTGFTSGDPQDLATTILIYGGSAWHWWQAPTAGVYQVRIAKNTFDTALGLFRGSPGTGMTLSRLVDPANPLALESLSFTATAGENIVFMVAGYESGGAWPGRGKYVLAVSPSSAMPLPSDPAISSAGEEATADPQALVENELHQLGGQQPGADDKIVLWEGSPEAPADARKVLASVKVKMRLPVNAVGDRFGWTAYDHEGAAIAAVWIDAKDGQMYHTSVNGTTTQLAQSLTSGSSHNLEFLLDRRDGVLKMFLDGVLLHQDASLPKDSRLSSLVASWLPFAADGEHATMHFGDVSVSYDP